MTEPNTTKPLVLIPGFSLTGASWQPVADALPTRPLLAEIPGGLDFPSTARALRLPQPAVYAGYSMGGRLALQIAMDRPDHVTALALISTSPGIADPFERAQRRREDDRLAGWIEQVGREAFLDHWLAQPLFAGLDERAARTHRLESAAAIADQLRRLGPGTHEPLWDRLESINQPVVVIAGQRDERYGSIATRIVEQIGPNARLRIVPNAGHAVPTEQPSALAGLLSEIL